MLLGGAAAWPVAARAQQPKLPTIGYLGTTTALAWSPWTAAFVQRLRDLGWIEGRTISIESRWAEGRSDRASEMAGELVRLKVDIIVTSGTPQVIALKQATSVIPIVSPTMGVPVGAGLIASLARPGGNVTGLSLLQPDLGGKRTLDQHATNLGERGRESSRSPLERPAPTQRSPLVRFGGFPLPSRPANKNRAGDSPRAITPFGGAPPREGRSKTADASRAKGLICHLVQNDPSDIRRMPRLTDACRTMLVSRPGARNHLALA